ncbi:MAG: 3-dehydroquinate synthase [Halioglobus sp.]
MHTLTVDLGERSYPIYIGSGLLDDPALLAGHIQASQVVLISNDRVSPLYLERVRSAVGERSLVTDVILPDGEPYKTLDSLSKIFDEVMAQNHNRTTTFVAVGGGVVGDITGFAAASYQRGVNFVQVPTTLLAQVDSSVGGKTAVNHPLGKNMIGAFYQPQAVVIDIETLKTLPDREFAAGLAEVIKYGFIADSAFYNWLQGNLSALMAKEEVVLAEAVRRSCEIKAAVVAEDEREGGIRAILNLGHTFGHAIETNQGYGAWLHGEAVSAGMVLALRLSAARGQISAEELEGCVKLLSDCGLPTEPPDGMSSEDFLVLMARDKKVVDGRLRLILVSEIGVAEVVDDVTEAELKTLLEGVS